MATGSFKMRQGKSGVIKPFQKKYRGLKKDRFSEKYQKACEIRSSDRWKKLSKMIKSHYPVCSWCQKKLTFEVHHIKPVSDFPDLAFNVDNLLPLCTKCHDMLHCRMRRNEDVETQIKQKLEKNGIVIELIERF